jgi:serine/threonine protein kinase
MYSNFPSSDLKYSRNIHHTNIIQLYGAVEEAGECGYVMEYCPNGSLYLFCVLSYKLSFMFKKHAQMNNGLVLGPVKMIELAFGIADVLSVLHDSAIVHRDIKSGNIMV